MHYKNIDVRHFEVLPEGDKINARLVKLDFRKKTKVFIFRETGSYSCLLQTNETSGKLPEIKGLVIVYQNFGEKGGEMMPYILVECRMAVYFQNFTEILKEVISDFDNGKDEMVHCVLKVIRRWRYFLSEPKSEIMSEENIVGLIGELMFLKKLLPVYNTEALNIWTADRGEEDFIRGNYVVEVKSTIRERHEHIINGIDQLLLIPGRTKYVLSLLFVNSDSEDSINLSSEINSISKMLSESPESNELFFQKLRSIGYDKRDSELYNEYRYSLVKGGVFRIDESFPKLTTEELSGPLNSRISRIRYSVDLEGLHNINFSEVNINNLFKNEL